MIQIILALHVLVALGLVTLILVQHGKGADMGAGFGAGASQTVFGSQGSLSFLLKVTVALAAVFFTTSILLGNFANREQKKINAFVLPNKAATAPLAAPTVLPSEQAGILKSATEKTPPEMNKKR